MLGKVKEAIIEGNLFVRLHQAIGTGLKNFFRALGSLWVNGVLGGLDFLISYIARKYYRSHLKIKKNRIAIMTNTFNYTCNPKYIYEELIRQNLNYDIYWIIKGDNKSVGYSENVKTVELGTARCFKIVYSAKIWIDNGIAFSNYFDKRPEQVHIQTMHGSLGIKRLDNAVLSRNKKGRSGQRVVKREENNTNLVITNSQFEEGVFKSIFWHSTPMERLGHARTDILFQEHNDNIVRAIREELCFEYEVPIDKKIVLYAPTYRANLEVGDLDIDYDLLCSELSKRFGGEYVVLLRLHNRSFKLLKQLVEQEGVYDVSRYPDIQELMLVADVGITDYSSWIYDYVNTRRPGFIYAADLDRYNTRTGFYYLLEETPFPVCEDNDELTEAIRSFDLDNYHARVEEFLAEKHAVDDGHSAERIAAKILEIAPVKKKGDKGMKWDPQKDDKNSSLPDEID